jgi:hypothetical protein
MKPHYFAEINFEDIVQRVIVVESIDKVRLLYGDGNSRWVEVHYDKVKNYPSKGYIYISLLNDFYSPQPYEGWILDMDTLQWNPKPLDKNVYILPNGIIPRMIVTADNKIYSWNNESVSWVEI